LAGGTVLKLGTARHHQGLLRGIDNVDDIGCFALTELGFGELCSFCLQRDIFFTSERDLAVCDEHHVLHCVLFSFLSHVDFAFFLGWLMPSEMVMADSVSAIGRTCNYPATTFAKCQPACIIWRHRAADPQTCC
jgi:hypothetical protein